MTGYVSGGIIAGLVADTDRQHADKVDGVRDYEIFKGKIIYAHFASLREFVRIIE